jgi:alpha-ketoglutarate-dependent taurine dioxygenase
MTPPAGVTVEALAPGFGDVVECHGPAQLKDLEPEWVAERFHKRGCLAFRGFGAGVGDFEAFTAALGGDFMTYQGGGLRFGPLDRRAITPDRTVLSATGSTQEFPVPMHGEMYYMGRPPEIIWFFCATPPAAGGETTVADGRAIPDALAPATRRLLTDHRLRFARDMADGEWQTAFLTADQAVVEQVCAENRTSCQWGADGSLRTVFECPAIIEHPTRGQVFINTILPVAFGELAVGQSTVPGLTRITMTVRLDDGRQIPADALENMHKVSNRAAVPVGWRTGDLLMVDNTWVLHGRRASEGTGREIFVRMCRFKHAA